MAMEVHATLGCDMDHFIRECVRLFHDRWSRGHLSLSFCIQFFKWHDNIAFQHALAYAIERKIVFTGGAYSKPPIIIRSHDLHIGDIKGVVNEIISYHKRDQLFPFFWFLWVGCLLAFPFCLSYHGSDHSSFIGSHFF
jgi:hypothetical protein